MIDGVSVRRGFKPRQRPRRFIEQETLHRVVQRRDSRPRVHKAFKNQARAITFFTMDFFLKTYYYYSTIDCCYSIKYVLQTRLLENLSFFMKEKVNFIVVTVKKS